jgi:hypothetical protein
MHPAELLRGSIPVSFEADVRKAAMKVPHSTTRRSPKRSPECRSSTSPGGHKIVVVPRRELNLQKRIIDVILELATPPL